MVATVHEKASCRLCKCSRLQLVSGSFSPMSSACDLLAPLQRWITYTYWEVLQIKRDLHEHRQEVLTTQKIQQQQWDTVQAQLREGEQRLLEVIEAAAELFQQQCRNHDLLRNCLVISVFESTDSNSRREYGRGNSCYPALPLRKVLLCHHPFLLEGVCVCNSCDQGL